MKKYSWLVAIFAILMLLVAGCNNDGNNNSNNNNNNNNNNGGEDEINIWTTLLEEADFTPGSGGSGGVVSGNLFSAGAFIAAVGETAMFSWDDDNETGNVTTTGNALTVFDDGAFLGVFFEKYIDVSAANSITLTLSTNSGQWWHGGILFFHNEEDPQSPFEAQWWDGGGASGGNLAYAFSNFTELEDDLGAPDYTKFVGFALKSTGKIDVTTIAF